MNKKDLWNEFCIWITPDGENRNNDLELLKEDLRAAKSLERDGLIDILGDSGMLPDGFLARLTDDGIVKAIKDYKGTSPIRQNIKDVAKINQFIRDRNEFSNKTFGSPLVRDCSYPLKHLQDEVCELLDAPDDKMGWADLYRFVQPKEDYVNLNCPHCHIRIRLTKPTLKNKWPDAEVNNPALFDSIFGDGGVFHKIFGEKPFKK
jgi:hypothetical protein